jgi:8-oxo-dGTP diphosphatase
MIPTHAVKAAILNEEGKLLMLQRNTSDGSESWDLPGGLVDPGEKNKKALKREVKEELGIDGINIEKKLNTWQFLRSKDNQIVAVQNYLVEIPHSDFELSNEHLSYKWINISELRNYSIKDNSFFDIISHL